MTKLPESRMAEELSSSEVAEMLEMRWSPLGLGIWRPSLVRRSRVPGERRSPSRSAVQRTVKLGTSHMPTANPVLSQ
ncbi:hypothetical protein AXF42_Ash020934 [Apostasia shenzhenica]|uniref:Uncharacterized protein n=1 Tax=Apostasia shenzhenica TaxID=1088818 RepID=A0A2H9ZYQ9_9ASPA|nr:hypothetical protein AXF42_Ash020934 [Apostasia shenzhenica]